MTNELLIGEIKKVAKYDPALAQWLSSAVGGVVNEVSGENANVGAAVSSYATKWNSFASFYSKTKIPFTDKEFVTVNLNNLKYAIKNASYTDAGTTNERMTLWMGNEDYMIINSGHGYYRDHKSQRTKGLPSFMHTDKFDVIQAVSAVAIEAEAGHYLDDGQVHKLTTQMIMINSYGEAGKVKLEVRVYKLGSNIHISTFYPVSIV